MFVWNTLYVYVFIGDSHAIISIFIQADRVPEDNETYIITLLNVEPTSTQKLRLYATRMEVLIEENDNPGGLFAFADSVPSFFVMEVVFFFLFSFSTGSMAKL